MSASAVALTDGGEIIFLASSNAQGFDPTETLVRKLEGLTDTVYVLVG